MLNFLTQDKGNALLEEEIEKGIGIKPLVYAPDEAGSKWTWENAGNLPLL